MEPVLLTVDDDPRTLRTIELNLTRQYGNHFRVLQARLWPERPPFNKAIEVKE